MLPSHIHRLWTGSGRTEVTFSFADDDTAKIVFYSRWMGSEFKRYKLQFDHKKYSETYGVLSLRSIERCPSVDTDEVVAEDIRKLIANLNIPEDEIDESYCEIRYEYIRLSNNEPYIPDEPDLEMMRPLGYAGWNDTFDLILLLHYAAPMFIEGFEQTSFGETLRMLDKMKFAATQ